MTYDLIDVLDYAASRFDISAHLDMLDDASLNLAEDDDYDHAMLRLEMAAVAPRYTD